MAIFYNKETNKKFFFIHIPRTAGRFLAENFICNNFKPLDCENIWKKYEGVEMGHFHKTLYEKYLNVNYIEHIAIVRNPIERFFSASYKLKEKYKNIDNFYIKIEDYNFFENILKTDEYIENWFRPQTDFISNRTNIWHYEFGFGANFEIWISNILKKNIKISEVEYTIIEDDNPNKLDKNLKIIKNIKKFYNDDFENFYPNQL